MKNEILRILIRAAICSLICSIVVTITGFMLRWKTSTQFSDGFFWAGIVLIAIGFVNLMGMFNQRTVSGLQYSQSAVHLDADERLRIWDADLLRGHNLLALLGTSGLLLFGLAMLIDILF